MKWNNKFCLFSENENVSDQSIWTYSQMIYNLSRLQAVDGFFCSHTRREGAWDRSIYKKFESESLEELEQKTYEYQSKYPDDAEVIKIEYVTYRECHEIWK